MVGDNKPYKPSFSELALLSILIVLVALTRVYYGGGRAPMIVWKDEFTFHDTLVNVAELSALPHDVMLKDHRSVLYQLEAMEIIEPTDIEVESIRHRQWKGRQAPVAKDKSPDKQIGDKPPSASASEKPASPQSEKSPETGENEQH